MNKLNIVTLALAGVALAGTVAFGTTYLVDRYAPTEVETQYRLYAGTNDKDTYQPMDQQEAMNLFDDICTTYFSDGYTLIEARGSWKDEQNVITHEYTMICFVSGVERSVVYAACDELIVALHQSSILIEESHSHIDFYSGRNV